MHETTTATGAGAPVAIVRASAPAALTPRGTAAVRLSAFQDAWDELTAEDRAWFAHWLTELLVDACLEPLPGR